MRLLSFLLAGVMTVTSVQMPVYAAEVDVEQEAVTGEGIEESESEAGTEAEEALKTPEKSIEEVEGADELAEPVTDSVPGDMVAEESTDPAISDAVVPESEETVESAESVVQQDVAEEAESALEESVEAEADEVVAPDSEEDVTSKPVESVDADPDLIQPKATVTSIEITAPTKRTYFQSEKNISLSGAAITVKYDDNTTSTVSVTKDMVSGYDTVTTGVKTVTITYDNTPKSFDVLVVAVPAAIDIEYGEAFSEKLPTDADGNGTWHWQGVPDTANKVGKQTYTLKFQPDDGMFEERTIDLECNVTCPLATYAVVNVTEPSGGYTYDGKEKEPNVAVRVGNTYLKKNTDFDVKYDKNKNAGTASIIITPMGYYTGNPIPGLTFEIKKARVTVKAKDQMIEYGRPGGIEKIEDIKYEYDVSGLAEGEEFVKEPVFGSLITVLDAEADYDIVKKEDAVLADVSDPLHPEYALKDNYEITYVGGTLSVTKFEPESVRVSGITVLSSTVYSKEEWSYDGKAVVRYVETNNTVNNVNVRAYYSGKSLGGDSYPTSGGTTTQAPTNAGQYTLTFKLEGPDAGLYHLEEKSSTFAFSIVPKTVTIRARSHTVETGESKPNSIEELKAMLGGDHFYTVTGLLEGDTEETVLDVTMLELQCDFDSIRETNVPPGAESTFEIGLDGAALKDKKEKNYEIKYEPGILTIKGRKKFEPNFTSINIEDMTYNGNPHSMSGNAAGYLTGDDAKSETYKIIVTGATRNPGYSNIDTNWNSKYDPEGSGNQSKYNFKRMREKVSASEIVNVYNKIAPTEVGNYTVRIFSEINQEIYDYDGEALMEMNFHIFPLQKYETRLASPEGISEKEYDGKAIDLSEKIKNAKVWTNRGVDITDKVKLEVWIRKTGGDSDYADTKFDKNTPDVDAMPADAGEYVLEFKIVADESENYISNEWPTRFVIKKKPLKITVKDKTIHVNAEGALPDSSEYEYTITDEEENILPRQDFDWLHISIAPWDELLNKPLEKVDTTEAGSYKLHATSNAAEGETRENNYNIEYIDGMLHVQTKLWGVKELSLTNNRNIPHGTTLKKIAEEYLPKTVVVYLDASKQIESKAAIEWNTDKPVAGSYNNSDGAQSFKMQGTVVLPDTVYVEEKDRAWLTVTVDVSVREANDGTQAEKPRADVASGTVGVGTRVNLSTDEEGAQIYYTIEADNPSLSVTSRRYTGPIAINCTMIIRAVSRVYGKLDSQELYLYYYYNKNTEPDDPDDPDGPEVPDEDVPKDEDGNPLDIPKGMWVTDVAQYTYSGTAVRPQVRVYDYRTRLEEDKDYTVSYKNNVKAADKNIPRKAPTIVIRGKGNYEGKIEKTFTIAPKNINDMHEENGLNVYDVKIDDITVAFAADKARKPAVAAFWNGKKLVNKKDFTFDGTPYTAVGTYPVTVTGNGNYTGERKISFTIAKAVPASSLTVNKIADYNYTGQEIRPTVIVTYQKAVLQRGLEYTVSYEDNKEIGTASVVVKGMGRFAGVKRVNFKIKAPGALKKAEVELVFNPGADVYTGKEIRPNQIKMAVQAENNGAVETRVLTENDYKVSYKNNVEAGTAAAIFEGTGVYGGTLKKTFKIAPCSLQDIPQDQITVQASYPYMKGGSRQKPVIRFNGKTLQEGADYTLSYKNNKRVGDTAVVTIKGKGNFKGNITRTYQVTARDISDMTVTAADKVYKPAIKNYTTKVRVTDSDGRALAAGKDYDAHIAYSYDESVVSASGETKEAGTPVAEYEIIPIGTKLRVTVTAIGQNFQGTATGTFRVVQADVAKAKVSVPTMTYTGKAIEPKQSEIAVTLNGIPLTTEDYKIVGYANNVNQGTAKLTIQGQGVYGGTKTVKFKIRKKSMIAQLFG